MFDGYLDRPDATAAARRGRLVLHRRHRDPRRRRRRSRIVGRRATDLIKTGGYKVGAGEVEAALLEHPAVREAAVIGVPDDDLGERIVAFVVAAAQSPAGRAARPRRRRSSSPHKRPRAVRVVDALPRNAMGKVQKASWAEGGYLVEVTGTARNAAAASLTLPCPCRPCPRS